MTVLLGFVGKKRQEIPLTRFGEGKRRDEVGGPSSMSCGRRFSPGGRPYVQPSSYVLSFKPHKNVWSV